MLKEICITPQVFDNQHIDDSNYKDIKNLLETIESSGYILGLNNQDWIKTTLQNINSIESSKMKDRFSSIFKLLKDRSRIVGHPKGEISPIDEEDWLKIAHELHQLREFHTILATKSYESEILSTEALDEINISERFGITGCQHYIKTDEELKKIFLPLLAYAKKVTIIDPYFDISEKRYKASLELIARCFKERRGRNEKGSITINCSSKIYAKESWKKIITDIFKRYGHIVTINIWERKEDNIKLHERYIITNQAAIVSGAGTDKDDFQQSEWSIKDYISINEILLQYKENSSPFKLVYTVTAKEIIHHDN
jgi:predicted phosphatase